MEICCFMLNYIVAQYVGQLIQPAPGSILSTRSRWMANPHDGPHPSAFSRPIGLASTNNAGYLLILNALFHISKSFVV